MTEQEVARLVNLPTELGVVTSTVIDKAGSTALNSVPDREWVLLTYKDSIGITRKAVAAHGALTDKEEPEWYIYTGNYYVPLANMQELLTWEEL